MSAWAAQRFLGELKRIQQGLISEVFAERDYGASIVRRAVVSVVMLTMLVVLACSWSASRAVHVPTEASDAEVAADVLE